MKRVVGVILCGGLSSRMGTDKGLIQREGSSWSQQAERLLESLGIPVFLSINKSQFAAYSKYHKKEKLVIDSVQANGPLTGILSVHKEKPDADLLVIACDLIRLQPDSLEHLLARYTLRPDAGVVAYQGEQLETLCAVYRASFLSKLMNQLETGTLPHFSLKKLVSPAELCSIPIQERQKSYFKNHNFQSDLDEQFH